MVEPELEPCLPVGDPNLSTWGVEEGPMQMSMAFPAYGRLLVSLQFWELKNKIRKFSPLKEGQIFVFLLTVG